MPQQQLTSPAAGKLSSARLGIWGIVFLVVSAAAPLTVVVSAAPMSFRLGGIGAPGALMFCGLVLGFFAVGFTAMSAHVPNAGAFYAYALHGLGRGAGVGLAFVTLFAYAFLCVSFYAFLGFFAQLTMSELFGIDLPWWVWAGVAVLIIAFLGVRQVDVGAKLLAVIVTAEVAILLAISIAVLLSGGPEPISGAGFNPYNIFFTGGVSGLLVIGFGAYLGFEGTAIYAEEARDAKRTIPAATYIAVAALACFYAFTFWVLTVVFGVDGIIAFATGDEFEGMVLVAGAEYLGQWAATLIQILIVTSFFACILAFHNAATRYMFSLGRERILPASFARTNEKSGSPANASLTLSVICAAAVGVAAFTVVDAYMGLAMWTYATGVQGLVFGQAMAAIAVVVYFLRDRKGHGIWRVTIAPVLGALGLVAGFIMIVTNFEITTGMEGAINWVLLAPTPLLFGGGFLYTRWLKRRSPETYANLGKRQVADEVAISQ